MFIQYLNTTVPHSSVGEESACNAGDQIWFQGGKDPLEKGIATHSSILAWGILWAEKPGVLQSVGSQESDTTKPYHQCLNI